jgi:hypothetical protein
VCRFEVVLNPFGKAHSDWLLYKHHSIPEHRLRLGRRWQPHDADAAAVAAARAASWIPHRNKTRVELRFVPDQNVSTSTPRKFSLQLICGMFYGSIIITILLYGYRRWCVPLDGAQSAGARETIPTVGVPHPKPIDPPFKKILSRPFIESLVFY